MKKVFSLILAVAMVLSLASVAFAAEVDNFDYLTEKVKNVECFGYENKWYTLSSGELKEVAEGDKFVFGKTYYMPIIANSDTNEGAYTGTDAVYKAVHYATFAKQIGSLKAVADITEGAEFVKSVDIVPIFVKKDAKVGEATPTTINRNIYAIALTTQGEATKAKAVVGEIVVTGKAGSGDSDHAKKIEEKIPVDFSVYYNTTDLSKYATGTSLDLSRTGTEKHDKCEIDTTTIDEVSFNDDIRVALEKDLDGKYLVSFNTIDDEAVLAANPDAAIMCYNITFNFRQPAEIEVDPIDEEGTNYLYQKLPSGAWKDLTSTYVEDDGLFEFTARKLTGTYYVSDMPLAH